MRVPSALKKITKSDAKAGELIRLAVRGKNRKSLGPMFGIRLLNKFVELCRTGRKRRNKLQYSIENGTRINQ